MVDRIDKALRRLALKERRAIGELAVRIQKGGLAGLDIKKLRGTDDIYRVRKGDLRIIFRKSADDVFILAIERRNDTTYREF